EAAQAVGVKYLVDPFWNPADWTDAAKVRALAGTLNRRAETAAEAGIRVGYHNHHFELAAQLDGRPALEVFAEELDPRVVLEIDTYWAAVGGADVPPLLERLGERVQLVHLKDGDLSEDPAAQLPLGTGALPLAETLRAAAGVAYGVIEFDDYAGDMFEGIEASIAHLRSALRPRGPARRTTPDRDTAPREGHLHDLPDLDRPRRRRTHRRRHHLRRVPHPSHLVPGPRRAHRGRPVPRGRRGAGGGVPRPRLRHRPGRAGPPRRGDRGQPDDPHRPRRGLPRDRRRRQARVDREADHHRPGRREGPARRGRGGRGAGGRRSRHRARRRHPDRTAPACLRRRGAGPPHALAPSYAPTLVRALGPVVSVSAVGSKARETRTIGSGPKAGEDFDVTVPTQVAALLRFASGQNATVLLSFDSPHSRTGFVEVYGTEATLAFPDPNVFDGDSALTVYRGQEPSPVPASGATTGRGLGVLEMARALRAGVPHRAQGEIAAHVLDVMVGIETAIAENSIVEIDSRFTEVEPMPADFDPYAATLATTAPVGA